MEVIRNALLKSKKYVSQETKNSKDDYSVPDKENDKEAIELNRINRKIARYVTKVFEALGNYDVRFDFGVFSIDDLRCNVVSPREVNVLCSLKHVPLQSLTIEEDDLPGRVKLALRDDFVERLDEVSWEDFSDNTSDGRYFDSTKVYESLSEAVRFAVDEVRTNNSSIRVAVQEATTKISIRLQLSKEISYRVNLFPSILVNNSCDNFQSLLKPFSMLPVSVFNECYFEKGIHVVARPNTASEDENNFWSITFNDIEKRIVLSETFECAKDCLASLYEKFKFLFYEGNHLSSYQIQAFVVREIVGKPNAKSWKKKCQDQRLMGILKSIKRYLRNGRCANVFTGVNLFEAMSQDTLDEIAAIIDAVFQGT